MNAARGLLRRGGVFVVRVPNGAFYGRLRRCLSRGSRLRTVAARAVLAQNNLLTFPYRWGFTPAVADAVCFGESGFEVVRVRGDVLVPIADEWTRRWARWEEVGDQAALAARSPRAARRGLRPGSRCTRSLRSDASRPA